ncbi:hypothetical protein HY635_00045 [Candidatus Uhrbacteria bacterium]|nr:hypothetical protein [Candidatus Uhrbacteria bacterium]
MLTSLCGPEITALAGQPFIVAFEARDAANELVPAAEVTASVMSPDNVVRFENDRTYQMQRTGRAGDSKGIVEFTLTASTPDKPFDVYARFGAETATIHVKVLRSALVAGGAAVRGADGRLYPVRSRATAPAVVTAIPACGSDIIIIDV